MGTATCEESSQLLDELTIAFAGLFGEILKPCCNDCVGHFSPRLFKLMNIGSCNYRTLAAQLPKEE